MLSNASVVLVGLVVLSYFLGVWLGYWLHACLRRVPDNALVLPRDAEPVAVVRLRRWADHSRN